MLLVAQIRLPEGLKEWLEFSGGFLLVLALTAVIAVWIFALAVRMFLRRKPKKELDLAEEIRPAPVRTENEPAFLAASMQGVIQRLRAQEKELERLHRLGKERAQQTERLTDAVTRNMPSGLLIVNSTGLITNANPAAQAALGCGALSYRRYTDLLGADSQLAGLLTRCLHEGHTFQREEIQHTTPAGDLRILGATVSPIYGAAPSGHTPAPGGRERVTGALCLLSDLTELSALQKEIRLKENLAALGEMSAGIAHEFKNALATISGYAQMIRREAPAGDFFENADRILQESRALTHVVTEFLRFARPMEVSDEIVDLAPLVQRVIAEVAEVAPGVTIRSEGVFAEVAGDDALLRQALLNLTRNAAEAATGRGAGDSAPAGRSASVVVRGELDAAAGPTPRGTQRILIADNGPGIPEADLPKVFLPFYTTKSNGTGLGLAIVQKIVLQHGGGIQARNRPEGGAEFILWLPAGPRAPQAVDSGPARI